jgi:hypothetical protein
MGIFKLKLFLFCPLLLVRQRSFTFAAYQQRLLLVEAGHTNEGARDYPHFQMTFGQTLQQLRNQNGIHR